MQNIRNFQKKTNLQISLQVLFNLEKRRKKIATSPNIFQVLEAENSKIETLLRYPTQYVITSQNAGRNKQIGEGGKY